MGRIRAFERRQLLFACLLGWAPGSFNLRGKAFHAGFPRKTGAEKILDKLADASWHGSALMAWPRHPSIDIIASSPAFWTDLTSSCEEMACCAPDSGVVDARDSVVECMCQGLARHRCRVPDGAFRPQGFPSARDSGVAGAGLRLAPLPPHSTTLARVCAPCIILVTLLSAKRNSTVAPARGAGGGGGVAREFGQFVLRTSMKASCGMLTLPMAFIFFLPSFCLSRSLRLRLMSPP